MIKTYEELEKVLSEITIVSSEPDAVEFSFEADADNGHTEQEILEMEQIMGLPLFKDYREFVKHYRSFEIVGDIYVDCDLNDTAEVTVIHRNNSKELGLDFPEDCYCIGNFEPDLPIFIQSSVTGAVYSCQVRRKGSLKKIADNFWEFMNAEVKHWQKYAAEYDTF
ncbi:SMI1/KNR4 family protein [Succinimonas sp.]|uniref:SMI1/KNR4 family protein n=1 Tax=Succinimonas sp. TaxID=1936151 RepID=UPI0038635666